MTTCATCGSRLSKDYLRVCGDNDDTVRDCPHCAATRRAESRRSTADGSGSGTAGEDSDSSKLVLTAETTSGGRDAEEGARRSERRRGRGGGPRRSGTADRQKRGRARAGVVDPETRDGESGAGDSILSSVFDALR